jgi:hypothetical protein
VVEGSKLVSRSQGWVANEEFNFNLLDSPDIGYITI